MSPVLEAAQIGFLASGPAHRVIDAHGIEGRVVALWMSPQPGVRVRWEYQYPSSTATRTSSYSLMSAAKRGIRPVAEEVAS